MGAVKFSKESREFNMFMDFWNICQAYWVPEDGNEKYWESLVNDCREFSKKHNNPFAMKLGIAFVTHLEEMTKGEVK